MMVTVSGAGKSVLLERRVAGRRRFKRRESPCLICRNIVEARHRSRALDDMPCVLDQYFLFDIFTNLRFTF